eukprot:12938768-Prorocentrum_lima.AAC.1
MTAGTTGPKTKAPDSRREAGLLVGTSCPPAAPGPPRCPSSACRRGRGSAAGCRRPRAHGPND